MAFQHPINPFSPSTPLAIRILIGVVYLLGLVAVAVMMWRERAADRASAAASHDPITAGLRGDPSQPPRVVWIAGPRAATEGLPF